MNFRELQFYDWQKDRAEQKLLLVGITVSLCQMIRRFFANGKFIFPAKSSARP